MERKRFLKDVLEICKNGKFNRTLELVISLGEIDNKCAVSLIVSCCNACVSNTSSPENILEDDLYELLKFVISRIEYLYEPELLSYLQSIYFILKTLGVKKQYDVIAKMKNMLVPTFLLPNLSSKHKAAYKSSAGVLHNLVVSLGTEKNSRYNDSLTEICYTVSNIYSKLSNPSSLLTYTYNCGSTLCCLGISTKLQEEYYLHVLDLLKAEELKSISQDDFKCVIKYLTLIYNNILQKDDFEGAVKFYEKAFIKITQVFQKEEHFHILTLLKFPLILSPAISNKKTESFNKCKRSLQKLNSSSSEVLENRLNLLIYTVVSYYKSKNSEMWNEFPKTFQLDLLQFIYGVGQFETDRQFVCSCNCLIKKNIYQVFSYLQYICTLLDITNRLQSEVAPDYHEKCSNLLIKFCREVQILKSINCEKWKDAWNILGMGMYNIGVHLYQKSNRASLFYFYKLIKYFIKFEGRSGKIILKFSLISSAFTAICGLNVTDAKSCMAYTALGMVFCPNQREYLISQWIKAKVGQRDLKTPESEEIQRVTLVSAFDKFQTQMASLTDDLPLLTVADKVDLLTFELAQYKKKWKSKVPMMSALKELYDIADLNTTVQVVVKVFGDCDLLLHDEVPKLIHRILKRYEVEISSDKKQHSESTVFLAVLYYLHYKYCVKDMITKNIDDMERTTIMVQKTSEPPDAIPRDPNEECDIVSSYECLKLDKYFSVIKYLNKSLSLFASVINDNFDPNCFETVMTLTVYNLLLKIFYEYRLHNHRVRGFQALQVALKLAQLENEPVNIIQTIGFILENSDVTRSYVKYLMLLADKQVANVLCTDFTNLKIILTYYICKAKAYLYQDYMEAHRIFRVARDLYEVQEEKNELLVIKCQLLLLHYKFIMLPCKLEIEDHQKNTLLTIHSANHAIYEVYNTLKLDGSYEISTLLDANEELTKLYHLLRSPREVRAYCRETIILTQKLVLPLRCALYLVYLSHADLRSSRFDDCQIKLDGLADILNLSKCNVQVDHENKLPIVTKLEKEIVDITNDMQEMVLDLPIPNNYKKQLCPSSPTLIIEPFHVPAFVSHDDSCDCFYCISFEYQELVLHKFRLDALLNVKQSNANIAMDFFRGALHLYERFCRKSESYIENVAKLTSYDLIPDLEKELMEVHANVLLDYSYHVRRIGRKNEALDITNKLINLISLRKLAHPHLYNEALIQKLGYLIQIPSITPKIDDEQSDMDTLCPSQTDCLSTTPESKQSKVTFMVSSTPDYTPPKRILKKCLPFDLSPSQENENNQINKKNPPAPKNLVKTPAPKNLPKTPAPKIKIYTNDDAEFVQAKTPAMNMKVYSSAVKKRTNKKQNLANNAFIAPETVSTPSATCPVNVENGLKSRTKLLTERLRQSTKTSEAATASANDENVVPNGKKKSLVRKNLLSELTHSETQQNKSCSGAIRKSTRNRK